MLRISQNGGAVRAPRGKRPAPKLDDKQSERDHRELRIDKVGVRGLRFPIQIRDKARSAAKHHRHHRHVCGFAARNSKART